MDLIRVPAQRPELDDVGSEKLMCPISGHGMGRQGSSRETPIASHTAGGPVSSVSKWEPYKEIIKDLYISRNHKLDEVMKMMKEEGGFSASKTEFERQLRRWGFRKNRRQSEWKSIRKLCEERKDRGLQSDVYFHGVRLSARKVRKQTHRCFTSTIDSLKATAPPRTPEAVAIVSPVSQAYLYFIKTKELPWQAFCRIADHQARSYVAKWMSRGMREAILPSLTPFRYNECRKTTKRIVDIMSAVMPLKRHEEIYEQLRIIFDPREDGSTWELLKLVVYLLSNNLLPNYGKPAGGKSPVSLVSDEILRWFQLDQNHVVLGQMLSPMTPTMQAFAEPILSSAARAQDIRIVRILLESGISPNTRFFTRTESLLGIVAETGNETLARLLIKFGADPNDSGAGLKKTALSCATSAGKENVAELLLASNASVDATRNETESPLGWAIRKGLGRIVRLLIERGAALDWECRNPGRPHTPLQTAARVGDVETASYLLGRGARVNAPPPNHGRTALQWAATGGHEEMVHLLLQNGAAVNGSGRDDTTALLAAVAQGHRGLVRLFLDRGADVNPEYTVKNALMTAVQSGDAQIVRELVAAGADIHRRCEDETVLQAAIANNDTRMVQLLLEAGADVHKDGALAAAVASGNGQLINQLLDAGCGIDRTTYQRQDALQHAARTQNVVIVQRLLALGADVSHDFPYLRCATALQWATYWRNKPLVRLLVEAGANPAHGETSMKVPHHDRWLQLLNPLQMAAGMGDLELVKLYHSVGTPLNMPPLRSWGGGTALQTAVKGGHVDVIAWLLAAGVDLDGAVHAAVDSGRTRLIQPLVDAGADITALPNLFSGHSALQYAARKGNNDMVRILLRAGADVNGPVEPRHGESALQAAAYEGHADTVELLLARGADVNAAPSRRRSTALQDAASAGYLRIAQILLDAGAHVNAPGRLGTALERAARNGRIDMIKLLLNSGASISGDGRMQFERAIEAASKNGHDAAATFLRCHQITA